VICDSPAPVWGIASPTLQQPIRGADKTRTATGLPVFEGVDLVSESPTVTVPVQSHYYQFDQQGVAFNMWYLAFLEQARNGYLTARGFSLEDLLASGHDIQLVHVEVDWSSALRYGDPFTIDVSSARAGKTSFTLRYALAVQGQVRATATSVYVIVDASIQGKALLPPGLRAALRQ
jgi:acyl-CoA thioester hydrolase